jgi:hypothetical protein
MKLSSVLRKLAPQIGILVLSPFYDGASLASELLPSLRAALEGTVPNVRLEAASNGFLNFWLPTAPSEDTTAAAPMSTAPPPPPISAASLSSSESRPLKSEKPPKPPKAQKVNIPAKSAVCGGSSFVLTNFRRRLRRCPFLSLRSTR